MCPTGALDPSALGLYQSKREREPCLWGAHTPNLPQEPPKLTDIGVLSSKDVAISQKVLGINSCRVTYCKTKHCRLSCPNPLR